MRLWAPLSDAPALALCGRCGLHAWSVFSEGDSLQYTAFYEFPRARLEKEQSDRHAAALRFFSETRVDAESRVELLLNGTPRRDPRYVDTCIAVLRDDREYFLPTMHSLLSAMRADERDSVHIVVVDTSAARSKANVTVHDLDFVRPFVDNIVTPEARHTDEDQSRQRHAWERQELRDYAAALRYCKRTMTKQRSTTTV